MMSIEWAKPTATELLVIKMSRPFAAKPAAYQSAYSPVKSRFKETTFVALNFILLACKLAIDRVTSILGNKRCLHSSWVAERL